MATPREIKLNNYRMLLKFFREHEPYSIRKGVISFQDSNYKMKIMNSPKALLINVSSQNKFIGMDKYSKGSFNDLINNVVKIYEGWDENPSDRIPFHIKSNNPIY